VGVVQMLNELFDALLVLTEAKKFWDTPEFKRWFGNSKVVDEQGNPKVVYSGHFNVNVFGEKYNPKRSVAGALYTTEDPEIASNYAKGKVNTGEFVDGSQYIFKGKGGKWNKRLHLIQLTDAQLAKLEELKKQKTKYDEYVHPVAEMDRWIESNKNYDKDARRMFLSGGSKNLFNIYKFYEYMGYTSPQSGLPEPGQTHFDVYKKNYFEILLDELGIEWDSAERPRPGVLPLYLSIQNPIDTTQPFPEDLLAALKKKARYERTKDDVYRYVWTSQYPLKQWVKDIEEGNEFWATHIPKKALPIMKQFGYDGICDRGGKFDKDRRHTVWVVFDPGQVKSVFNKGTFNPNSSNILEQR
jgi:hypothetical protein